MRLALLLTLLACACASTRPAAPAPMTGSLPGDRIPSFQATVHRPSAGLEEPFDSHATKGATLYIVNSTTCPFCEDYAERMREIEQRFMPRGIDVVHVYPNRAEPAEEKRTWHAAQRFLGGQILDTEAAIAHLLAADRTPMVYVARADGILAYRGAIDDAPSGGLVQSPYLADALEAILAGRPVTVESTDPYG